ncbi:phospholipase-like protein, partial [Tanacetum coccineum]
RQMELLGDETDIVPLYYHIVDNIQIQFGREEFCLITGLRFRVAYWADYTNEDDPILFRRRVFSSAKYGILQFVLLGLKDRRGVPDWILRRVPIERLTPDENEARSDWWVSSRAYFDVRINEAERVPHHDMSVGPIFSLLKCAQATPSYGHNMATPNWKTPMPSHPGTSNWQTQMPSRLATLNLQTPMASHPHDAGLFNLKGSSPNMYRRTPYMDLPPTTVVPKKRGDKTKNKVQNANLSSLNLENAFADDNVRGDDVMFLGEHDTGNCLVYENVDPSKVRREDYIECMEFLLNPYDVYLDCHMIGYMVPDYFWRQLVPHLCMSGSHSLERANQEGWLSDDVYMPINAGGNHWVTGAINLPAYLFYVFDSFHSEGTRLMLEQQVRDWTPVINGILQSRGCFNGTG